jgi:hypothetical protein
MTSATPAKATPTVAVAVLRCGAKTRKGGACRNAAGFRTIHPGQGRCNMHGGLQENDGRLRTGRYSTVKHERLRELIAAHADDADPLDIFPELAALRALFQDFVERHEAFTEALLAWHADWQLRRRPLPEDLLAAFERVVDEWEIAIAERATEATTQQTDDADAARKFITILRGVDDAQKPRTVLDISDAYRILGEIARVIEREEKKRSANAVSRPDLNRIMHEMWRSVEARVPDDETKKAIREDWLRVRL